MYVGFARGAHRALRGMIDEMTDILVESNRGVAKTLELFEQCLIRQ
jgi:hypothetical protein